VQVWDPGEGQLLHCLSHRGAALLECLAVSKDGQWLAVGDRAGNVWLWSLADVGKTPRCLAAHRASVAALAFAGDGTTLASACTDKEDRCVRLWDVPAGKMIAELTGHNALLSAVVFTPDSKRVLSGDCAGFVCQWDVATRKEIQRFEVKNHSIHALHVSANGKSVIVEASEWQSQAKKLQAWELTTAKPLPLPASAPDNGETCALSSDGRYLAVSTGATVIVCAVDTGELVHDLTCQKGHVQKLAFSGKGKQLAAVTANGFCVWDVGSGLEVVAVPVKPHEPLLLRCLPDGKTILSVDDNAYVHCWDAATGKLLRAFWVSNGKPPVSLSPDGKVLALRQRFGMDGVFVHVGTGQKQASWQMLPGPCLAFSPDSKVLALGVTNTLVLSSIGSTAHHFWSLELIDVATGKELPIIGFDFGKSHATPIQRLWFSADGKRLVISGGSETWITEVASQTKQHVLKTKGVPLFLLPGDRTLVFGASADMSKATHPLKDVESGLLLHMLPIHTFAELLAISPQGNLAAYRTAEGGSDTLTLRTMPSGKRLLTLTEHLGSVWTADFSPDGNYLVTGGAETAPLVWDVQALLRVPRPAVALQAEELKSLWTDLGSAKWDRAVDAIDRLAASPATSVAWLEQQVKPLSAAKLEQWLAELDSPVFATREKAGRELAKLEFAAAKALRNVLKGKPSLELRQRVELLLKKLDEPTPAPQWLATWRAVFVLEQIDTPAARKLLEALAQGAPEARLTEEAQAALQRLAPEKPAGK
jgi:WD40 repeat protein